MFRSRLTLKAIALMIGIVVLCTVVIGLFIISSTQEITYGMEEKYALSLLDRVEGLVRAKSQEIQSYRKQAMQAKKQELKDITAVAEGYIQSKYKEVQAGSLAEDRAKKEALERVRHFLYGDKDYIYIANFDSVLISHPDPKLHNADFSQINDIYGNPIVPALVETAREKGQGFSSYWWNRLGRDKPSKKLTFSKLFVPWSWVYGTGVYLDDIEEEVRRKKTELIDQLRTMLSEITLGQTGYMFIFNADNKMIIHPDQGLEGRNFGHLKDPLTGEPIAGRLRAVAEQKEPLRYVWDSPDDQGNFAYDKLSWVRYNDQFDWYLCSSVYTDELHTNSMYLTKYILLISLLVCCAAAVIGSLFFKNLLRPLTSLTSVALRVRKGDLETRSQIQRKDEIGILSREFDAMVDRLQEHLNELDTKVREKTKELEDKYLKLQEANTKIMESIHYAKTIQQAILSRDDQLARLVPECFTIWQPKDVISGDLIWSMDHEDGFAVAVIDCTGHGVPGGVMTMIAISSINRMVHELGIHDPGRVLQGVSRVVQSMLKTNGAASFSEDGLDIGLCFFRQSENKLFFAGGRLGLFCYDGETMFEIKGDRESLGYRSSNPDHLFTTHSIDVDRKRVFYMATDGFVDQVGELNGFPLGRRRFLSFLKAVQEKSMFEQKQTLYEMFANYRGKEEQRDDVTVVGIRLYPTYDP